MAPSGQARTQALQRVQTSRSLGFSWRHSTSNAPSQPSSWVTRPDQTGYRRSSGSSPLWVASTETLSCPARRSAQSSAASAGPMIRSSPPDLNSTAGAGSGSGSAAMATSAAIFGVASVDRTPQPACSRTFTNFKSARSASSPKSVASCVHATITSPSPSTAWNAAASLRQSCSWTTSGSLDFNAAASALASIPTVRLQLQTLSVLPARLILLCFPLDFLGDLRGGLRGRFPLVGGFLLFLGE